MKNKNPGTFVPSLSVLNAAIGFAICSGAWAQQADVATLPTVSVTGAAWRNYAPAEASSATRTSTPLKETPATVQVVDKSLIADKAIASPRELADVVAGVQPVIGYGNTASQWFVIRGFSSAGVNYRDGYRSAEVYTPRDLSNVERIEFVKGPQSVLYGQAQPAGAVNTITKTPQLTDFAAAELRFGSFSAKRATLDINRAFGDNAVRLVAAADEGGSWLDHEKPRNMLLAPSLRFKLGDAVQLLYSGEFQRTTVDGFSNGLPMAPGVFDQPAHFTISQPWARLENRNTTHRLEARVDLGQGWAFRQGLYDSKTKRKYQGVSPAFNQFDGTPLADYPIMYNAGPKDVQRNRVWQSEVTGTVTTGALKHTLLVGFEAFRSRFDFGFYDQFGCDNAGNCYGGYTTNVSTGIPFPTGGFTGAFEDSSGAKTRALYVNDQIAWGDWRVMLGLRHDRLETSAGSSVQKESATTGRLGVLYLLSPDTSVYYSAGQSFVPNLGERLGGGTLDPEKGLQHEVGVKHSWRDGLESTLSLFQITKSNIRYLASGPTRYLTFGEQQSRGLEATLSGRVTSTFSVIANYAWLDYAKVTQDNNPAAVGRSLYGVARHNFNVWGLQALPLGGPGRLSVGAGLVHVSERPADNNASGFKLPAYTRIDLGLFYKLPQWDLALNVKNLNDDKVFDTAEGYFVQRQMPRAVSLSATYHF